MGQTLTKSLSSFVLCRVRCVLFVRGVSHDFLNAIDTPRKSKLATKTILEGIVLDSRTLLV